MGKALKKADVCIIGSGAGGGVVAKELTERGIDVVVLEAGRKLDPLRDYTAARPDYQTAFWKEGGEELFKVPSLQTVTLDDPNTTSPPHEGNGLGGSTLLYLAYAMRMVPDDFHMYSSEGVGSDWPISYNDLVPYYRKVELELGVSGLSGDPWIPQVEPYPNPPFPFSYANKVLKRGCDKLGIRLWSTPMARLSRPFDGRPMCVQCGVCAQGCMSGAKSSTDVTYIKKAETSGKAIIRTESTASRIKVDSNGKAKSVIYFDKHNVEHEQEAEIVVVSAGAIQSPRLLLNSKSKYFPEGLSNTNGLVGKYYMQHVGYGSSANFPERTDSFRGFFGGASSRDFERTSPHNSFSRGWCIELHSGNKLPMNFAANSSAWGMELKNYMRNNYGYSAGMNMLGEDLPDERNRIELDPDVRDQYGMPVPKIFYQLSENSMSMIQKMGKVQKAIYDAAGATDYEVKFLRGRGRSAHNAGGCRMGNNPEKSVLNSFCQSHEVSNLFVVDASCFVTFGTANPSLTIHAVAARASEYIVEQARRGNL